MVHFGNISLREAILRKKAEIQDIENTLAASASGSVFVKGRWGRVTSGSRQRLIEKKAHLELAVGELEVEELLQAWHASSGDLEARTAIEKRLADRGVTLRKPTIGADREPGREDSITPQGAVATEYLARRETGEPPPQPLDERPLQGGAEGAMEYPSDFPLESRARVEAEKIRAGRDFDSAKQFAKRPSDVEVQLRQYILRTFLAFAKEAQTRRLWTVDEMDSQCREFLRLLTIDAYYKKGYDKSGSRLLAMTSEWGGSILSEVEREFEKTPEWKVYQDALLELAEVQSQDHSSDTALGVGAATATTMPKAQPGRPPRLDPDFVEIAGNLWMEVRGRNLPTQSNPNLMSKVTDTGLAGIASTLDEKGYVPPAKYLEKGCADDLKSFNSRNSNSKAGAIKTWSQLVSVADKDHLRGMRRLLSRCAEKSKSHGRAVSGK